MKKKIGLIKLRIISGKASPAPPVGPALGQKGLNIMDFCKKFNNSTKDLNNILLSVKIFFYSDKSYDFIFKKPSLTYLIKDKLKIDKFFNKEKKSIKFSDIIDILKYKFNDFNTNNFYSSLKILIGSIKSMGLFLNYDKS